MSLEINKILDISEAEVSEYRDMYYGYVKPSIKNRIYNSDDDINKMIKSVLIEKFTISFDRYNELKNIDLFQRLSKLNIDNIRLNLDDSYVPDERLKETFVNVKNLLELRCPIRSEDKTPLNN